MQFSTYGNDFEYALHGYCLTTAEIIYHLPDHPHLLQMYLWQEFDIPPRFPRLIAFIDFWHHNIEGRIETIRVMTAGNLVSNSIMVPAISLEIH